MQVSRENNHPLEKWYCIPHFFILMVFIIGFFSVIFLISTFLIASFQQMINDIKTEATDYWEIMVFFLNWIGIFSGLGLFSIIIIFSIETKLKEKQQKKV